VSGSVAHSAEPSDASRTAPEGSKTLPATAFVAGSILTSFFSRRTATQTGIVCGPVASCAGGLARPRLCTGLSEPSSNAPRDRS
jgi:hypothetical protein